MERTQFTPPGAQPGRLVFDITGQEAQVVSSDQNDGEDEVIVRRQDGPPIRLPQTMLTARPDGNYQMQVAFATVDQADASASEKIVIPVIEEELRVDKRTVETGRGIRVHQHVVEHSKTVDEPLQEDVLEINHIPIGRMLEQGAVPQPRQEGDTFIVPVLEEVLVVQRQLRLKEEVHITRRQREVHAPQTVVLKSHQVSVERFDENSEIGGTTSLSNNPKEDTNKPGAPAR